MNYEELIDKPRLHIWQHGETDDDYKEVVIPQVIQDKDFRLRLLRKLVDACPDSLVFLRNGNTVSFCPSNIPDTPWHTDIGFAIERDFQAILLRWLPQGEWHLGITYLNDSEFDDKRMRQLASMPYKEYLKTPEWQERRKKHLIKADYRCQVCNTKSKRLEVHHRTYERRGHERYEDLIVLCEDCHELFHKQGKLTRY